MEAKKTNFQLVNKVLDQLRRDVTDQYGEESIARIKARFGELTAAYGRLWDPTFPAIDYAPADTRYAYVYTYVASHADWVYQALCATSEHVGDVLVEKDRLIVSCLGGGPGSELVGLVQYLSERHSDKLKMVSAYLCDREQAWADCWTEIGAEVEADFNLHVNFQPLDVTKEESWSKQKKFLSADLFLCIFFASEIARLGNQSMPFWNDLNRNAKTGALMVVIDNNSDHFKLFIADAIIRDAWVTVDQRAWDFRPSRNEEKSDLGEHFKEFERHPRMKGNSVLWVLRKV